MSTFATFCTNFHLFLFGTLNQTPIEAYPNRDPPVGDSQNYFRAHRWNLPHGACCGPVTVPHNKAPTGHPPPAPLNWASHGSPGDESQSISRKNKWDLRLNILLSIWFLKRNHAVCIHFLVFVLYSAYKLHTYLLVFIKNMWRTIKLRFHTINQNVIERALHH